MTTIIPDEELNIKKEFWSSLEKHLWEAADNLRANSDLKSQEYSLLFLS